MIGSEFSSTTHLVQHLGWEYSVENSPTLKLDLQLAELRTDHWVYILFVIIYYAQQERNAIA